MKNWLRQFLDNLGLINCYCSGKHAPLTTPDKIRAMMIFCNIGKVTIKNYRNSGMTLEYLSGPFTIGHRAYINDKSVDIDPMIEAHVYEYLCENVKEDLKDRMEKDFLNNKLGFIPHVN